MSFDTNKFTKAKLNARQATVPVPEMKDFFKDGTTPEWVVAGMTGEIVARSNEASQKNDMMLSVMTAMQGKAGADRVAAIQDMLGINTADVPKEIVRRKEMLVACSVKPKCSEEMAIKLAATFPTVFYSLTSKIIELTGLGHELGKQKASGNKAALKKA